MIILVSLESGSSEISGSMNNNLEVAKIANDKEQKT